MARDAENTRRFDHAFHQPVEPASSLERSAPRSVRVCFVVRRSDGPELAYRHYEKQCRRAREARILHRLDNFNQRLLHASCLTIHFGDVRIPNA